MGKTAVHRRRTGPEHSSWPSRRPANIKACRSQVLKYLNPIIKQYCSVESVLVSRKKFVEVEAI